MSRFAPSRFTPLLVAVALFVGISAVAHPQAMTCIECHVDPTAGGVHGGFRGLTNLTDDQIDVVCISCHDGSYTNPGGIDASEAEVHQNKNPGENRDEYGDFKASCLDCHTPHSGLLAGDGSGNANLKQLGQEIDEASSSDGVARIRKPVILDVLGNNGGSSQQRYEDDVQTGWECDSGVDDDPACVESDPPAAVDGVRKLTYYLDIVTEATHWAPSSPPYTGACTTCHTRTEHHRRDDSGGDHTHNISRACDDCHDHKDGWVNKGG
jgi:hypothetical protein